MIINMIINDLFPNCNTLMYLHSKNVMFRDLKPQNVGFDGKFGLCRDCSVDFLLRLKYHVLIF